MAITGVSCSCCKFLGDPENSLILCAPEHILTGLWWICRILLEGEKDGLLMLPSDKALLDEPKTRALVELYAKVPFCPILNFDNDFDRIISTIQHNTTQLDLFTKIQPEYPYSDCLASVLIQCGVMIQDEDKFFEDYAVSHMKLSELG